MKSAYISEIYSSVQGEGPYAGERQIFVRLAGCPLRCSYCDTPGSLTARGHRQWSVNEALVRVRALARKGPAKTVSLTGGEPLAQAAFLQDFLPSLKKHGFRTYLETAGVHPVALKKLVRYVDVISMDMKLPSATGKIFWNEHRDFLTAGRKKTFVKIVLEKKSKLGEIKKALGILSRFHPAPLLVLQPATPIPGQVTGPSAKQVADAFALARKIISRVLVMPQQHKIWGAR